MFGGDLARRSRTLLTPVRRAAPFILAFVLLVAIAAKIADLEEFSEVVETFSSVPLALREWLALAVPMTEIVVAYLILLPATRTFGLYCCLVLLTIFSGYLATQIRHPFAPTCHCLGVI